MPKRKRPKCRTWWNRRSWRPRWHPGAGGAGPHRLSVGYAQLNDLQVGADNQRHLKGQFTSIEGPDGELGDIGPVGDQAPGEPGRGASDKNKFRLN